MADIRKFAGTNSFILPMFGFLAAVVIIVVGPNVFIGTNKPAKTPTAVESLKWINPIEDGQGAIRDRTARSVMQMAKLLLLVICACCLAKNCILVARGWRTHGRYKWAVCGMGLVLIYACIFFVNSSWNPFWVSSVPYSLFKSACSITGSERLLVTSVWTHRLVQITLISFAVVVSFEVAKTTNSISSIATQLKNIRTLLFQSALVLFCLSIAGASNVLWASALLPTADSSFAQKLAMGVAMDAGVYNLVLLAFVFSPAIWTVTHRVPDVVRETLAFSSTDEERNKVMETYGLVSTPADYYWQVGSMLSPLLGGIPFTAMLTFLVK